MIEDPATDQARSFADTLLMLAADCGPDVRALLQTAASMIEVSADLIDAQKLLIADLERRLAA